MVVAQQETGDQLVVKSKFRRLANHPNITAHKQSYEREIANQQVTKHIFVNKQVFLTINLCTQSQLHFYI